MTRLSNMAPEPGKASDLASERSFQHTLSHAVTVDGVGLHTGEPCSVTLHPLDASSGIQIKPAGASDPFPARWEFVKQAERCTSLGNSKNRVMTVEHLIAALSGCGVDNCQIDCSGPEIPIGDGSALTFVEAIDRAGITRQGAERRWIELDKPIWIEENGCTLLASPASEFRIVFGIHFPGTLLERQVQSIVVDEATFRSEIAPARTFGFLSEVEELRRLGLARGGNLVNAVVVAPDAYLSPLRFPDEPVRHKILDLIGDLFLAGGPVRAEIVALKSSHRLNTRLAQIIGQVHCDTEETVKNA